MEACNNCGLTRWYIRTIGIQMRFVRNLKRYQQSWCGLNIVVHLCCEGQANSSPYDMHRSPLLKIDVLITYMDDGNELFNCPQLMHDAVLQLCGVVWGGRSVKPPHPCKPLGLRAGPLPHRQVSFCLSTRAGAK